MEAESMGLSRTANTTSWNTSKRSATESPVNRPKFPPETAIALYDIHSRKRNFNPGFQFGPLDWQWPLARRARARRTWLSCWPQPHLRLASSCNIGSGSCRLLDSPWSWTDKAWTPSALPHPSIYYQLLPAATLNRFTWRLAKMSSVLHSAAPSVLKVFSLRGKKYGTPNMSNLAVLFCAP